MDKGLLERSLVLVDGEEDALTRRFYDVLFTRYPQVQPMFSADVRPQAAMLRQAVIAVIEHLDDAQWLESTLHALGARHEGLGVTAPMYAAVAECMIATMQERGGPEWTPAMSAAWTEALGAVATMMLAGYRDAESVA
ncbi:globin domain-containing protein [Aldersonia sp. NBC_00410]|jgi:hemoglobin-like flavoprotein|uniref:globin domain-containing protein n=1 Tax=Aldersonia sp. NBC_00410 TaxID=2975954 RepID=UPI0022561526|nr:globin domain-containing protein [Aldersonia sp. NBC_00410]MCX5046172.1 globin domain-containing protein [Aldersonia sp. NBC_00410]